jgi:hypothetical protein
VDWINIDEAARLLQVSDQTLRNAETTDGKWCIIWGQRLRVWVVHQGRNWQRRYSRAEIKRLLWWRYQR